MRAGWAVLVSLVALPVSAKAEPPRIEHAPVRCIVAGRYPKLSATFDPAPVARARTYFRPQGVPSWYYVDMAPDPSAAPAYAGVLPRPTRKLVGQKIDYYVEASSRSFESGRTLEHDPLVVARPEECQEQPVAAYASGPPPAVFPALPPGFAVGGGGPVAALMIVGGGAVAAGAVLATRDAEAPATTATRPPAAVDVTVPRPAEPIVQPEPLRISCQAQPRQGVAPLRVLFQATAAGGTGRHDFAWTFGDGQSSSQATPGHTYERPGTYRATVVVTSGPEAARCEREIVVDAVAAEFPLVVTRSGSGLGTVTGPHIGCGADCNEVYPEGTVLELSAEAAAGSAFGGWSGDCTGAGRCLVRMDQARAVNAIFHALSTLTVSLTGAGGGSVSGPGIACPTDCTETQVQGTAATLTATPAVGSTFGGWGGACSGTGSCTVTLSGPVSVSARFDPIILPLTVARAGTGAASGRVTGPGIDCGTDCGESYAYGTSVPLQPSQVTGAPPALFTGWSGDCSGLGPCDVAMTAARSVTAHFTRLFLLRVGVSGPGRVTSSPSGISCDPICVRLFEDTTTVTLTATPNGGESFVRWTGDCAGTVPTCTLLMNVDHRVGAEFFNNPNLADPGAGAPKPEGLSWATRLEAAESWARVLANGTDAGVVPHGAAQLTLPSRPGVNRIEGQLQSGTGQGGTWRFELLEKGTIEAGSLRVLEGEVALVTEDAIVFRVSGRAGERIAFTYRPRN